MVVHRSDLPWAINHCVAVFQFLGRAQYAVAGAHTRQILSALIALCGVFPWSIVIALPWSHSYSAAVYSPNRKTAARIDDYNASGFGGADTSVELFTFHGLKQDIVYLGDFKTVGANDLRWKNDSELEIYYDGPTCGCKGTQRVLVRCVPKSSIKPRQPQLDKWS